MIKKEHHNLYKSILKKSKIIKKIFSMNLSQSFVMDGNRIISIEDIFGTNDMINKIAKAKINFNNLIFIKSIKKDQIFEIDFPIIGNETLTLLNNCNFKNAIIDPENVIAPTAAPMDISIKLPSLISPLVPKLNASGFKNAEIATKTAANPTRL